MFIRRLTTLELILNRSHYDYEHGAFVNHFNDDRLVFDRFHTILHDVSSESSYCGMMAFSGISAALSISIQSYCSLTKGAYFLSEPLSRIVRGCMVYQNEKTLHSSLCGHVQSFLWLIKLSSLIILLSFMKSGNLLL